MKKGLVDIFIAIENETFMKILYVEDKDKLMTEVNKRLYEITGMLELARLMEADKKFIEALERQAEWLIKRRNEVH